MLLNVDAEEEQRAIFDGESFCLKRAVVECLRSPEAQAFRNSLDFDSLKKMLISRYAIHFTEDKVSGTVPKGPTTLTEAQEDRLYHRLAKLINRNTHIFAKCAKTYSLKCK